LVNIAGQTNPAQPPPNGRAANIPRRNTMSDPYDAALKLAGELLGQPLEVPLGPGEPDSGRDFRRLATLHTFGDSWTRTQQLDTRTRSLISVAITAALGTHEPLRGQLRIALHNGVSRDEIVELFIHLEAYAGAARAFDSYQIAAAVFAEQS
jgi:4-carboxymuconolactone decarboxylase